MRQRGSSEPYPYCWLAKSRRSVSLAHLAAGKAVQKAGLLRFQAAQHIQEREEELLAYLREQILRDPRNPLLFGKLAELEERLGYTEEAAAHSRRQAELEAALR